MVRPATNRIWVLVSVVAVVALTMAACGPAPSPEVGETPEAVETPQVVETPTPEEPPAGPTEGGTLIIAFPEEPLSLDPHYAWSTTAAAVNNYIFDPYVTFGEGAVYEPGLFESWEIAEDNLTYTFSIVPGIQFSDGEPFDAEAAKINLDRLHEAWGWAEWTVTVLDEYTVQVVQDAPYSVYLGVLSSFDAFPQSPKALDEYGEEVSRHPVGTGPFALEEWVAGDHITLVRNPNHVPVRTYVQNDGPAYLDEVVFRFIPEAATQVAALEAGEVHVVFNPPPHEATRLGEEGRYGVLTGPSVHLKYIDLDSSKPPFDDVRVRKALMYALDIEAAVGTIMEGFADRACGMAAPSASGYSPQIEDECVDQDLDAADDLLTEAGWVDSDNDGIRDKDGAPLAITMVFSADVVEAGEVMFAKLADVGFDVQVEVIDIVTVNAMMREDQFTQSGAFRRTNYFDADTLWWFVDGRGAMLSSHRWAESPARTEYKRLVDEARTVADLEARKQLYYEAMKILSYDEALCIPAYALQNIMLTGPDVQGFRFDPMPMAMYTVAEDAYLSQ